MDEEENKEESDHMKEVRRFVMELMDRGPQIHSIFDLSPLLSIVMLLQVRTSLLFLQQSLLGSPLIVFYIHTVLVFIVLAPWSSILSFVLFSSFCVFFFFPNACMII